MELKLKAWVTLDDNIKMEIGTATFYNAEIVAFEKHQNAVVFDKFSDEIFPIKRSDISIKYKDKYDPELKTVNASIRVKDSIKFDVKISYSEKIKLKWMFNKYWIQKSDNLWKITAYAITTILAILTLIYTILK